MSARLELPLRSIRLVIAYAASWDPSDDAERWFKFAPCKARVAELEDRFMFIRPSFRGTARGTLKNAVKQLRTVETRELTKVFRALRRGGVGAREAMVRAVAEATPGEFYERLCAWYDRERFRLRAAVRMRSKLYYQLCKLQLAGDGAAAGNSLDADAARRLRDALAQPLCALSDAAVAHAGRDARRVPGPPPSHPSPYAYFPPHSNSAAPHPAPAFDPSEARLQRGVFRV
ncbi:hypothetical protein JL720_1025 [Aureococcus anophagefferens]|nr:hypothetical protein JL720_1025 [Aureococcus anophagefferens]